MFVLFDFTFGAISISVPIELDAFGDNAVIATVFFFSAGFLVFTALMPLFGHASDVFGPRSILIGAGGLICVLFTAAWAAATPRQLIVIVLLEYAAAAAAYASACAAIGRQSPGSPRLSASFSPLR
ncbi:hypothetical protein E0H70_28120 [Rhizobium leguminosarum bv. viciae]|nr:hypothetical protein E0H70_28120 [Rhizobium leguminosarum bv. viciae]